MARPRTPTEILDLRGTFKKNPKRRRAPSPKSCVECGDAPSYLSSAETACWIEITQNAPRGVLTSADRLTIEMVARLLARFRADWLTGAEMSIMRNSLADLGWTPASRSKIIVPKVEAPNEFAEFLN